MVIIFCGIPGCDKTTIAKDLFYRLKKFGSVNIFISDELEPSLYKKFSRLSCL